MRIPVVDKTEDYEADIRTLVIGGRIIYDLNFKSVCSGPGRARCKQNGYHSWFNHSVDSYFKNPTGNIPPEYEGIDD